MITHEDVRDLTRIEDVDRLEHLVRLLNPRIASPLSINSLREDLDVAFETVRGWLHTLERLYYIYSVPPYSHRLQRAIKREQKYYYWDWSEVADEPARFENFVMSHLNCKNIVQVVSSDNVYRQVKIDSQICHLVSAGVFLRWLE